MSHLSRKKPVPSDLENLDTFDLAFLVLTGNVRMKSPVEVLLDALKANGDVVLWGPQAKLLARVMRNGWESAGGEDLMGDLRAAFDTAGEIAVKSGAVAKAFRQYANIGDKWWSDIKERVAEVDAEIITRADRHYDRQRDAQVEKANAEDVAGWYQSTMQDHVEYFARNFPAQTLHPEVERLVRLAQEKEGFRTIDRGVLAERIDRIGAMPGRFIDGMADVEAGRAWQMTALQTAEAQNVTEYQIIAERDQVTCPVCEHIDGRVFSLQHGYRKMEQYFQLTPDQVDDIASLFPFPRLDDVDNKSPDQVRSLDLVPPFHPRCYADGTEVLTDSGWVDFKDLRGDELFMSRAPSGKIEYVRSRRYVEYEFNGEMTHISNAWFDLFVTPDHFQPFEKRVDRGERGRNYEYFLSPVEDMLLGSEWRIPRTGKWEGTGSTNRLREFATFMGHYLAEGSVTRRGRNWYQISLSQIEPKLTKMFLEVRRFRRWAVLGDGKIYIADSKLGQYLLQFGRSSERFVPKEIKQASPDIISSFLRAYLSGDGSVRESRWDSRKLRSREEVFSTSSTQMASDLGELILKTGGYPSYSKEKSAGDEMRCPRTGKVYHLTSDVWKVRSNRSEYATSQNLRVQRIPYSGIVRDVELVKNHVLCVRYNGKVCFSGNCRCEMVMLWTTQQIHTERRFTVGTNDVSLQRRLVLRDQLVPDWKDHAETAKRDLYLAMGKDVPDRKVAMAYSGKHVRMLARYKWIDDGILMDEFFKVGTVQDGGCLQTLAREAVIQRKLFRNGIIVRKPANVEAMKFLQQMGFVEKTMWEQKYWHLDENGIRALAKAEAKSRKVPPGMKGPKVEWVQPSPMAPKPPSVKAGNYSEALLKYEKEIAVRSREKALFFDDAGNLLFQKSGDARHVQFDPGEIATWAKGKVITHNHPGVVQVPFSRDDIRFLITKELKEIRAVTKDYRYRAWVDWDNASIPKDREVVWSNVGRRMDALKDKWRKYYYDEYYAGRIKDKAEVSRLYRVAQLKELSQEFKWLHFEALEWPNAVVPTPVPGVPGGSRILPKKYTSSGIVQRTKIEPVDVVRIEKMKAASANETYVLELKDGGKGVFKPTSGEHLQGMRWSIQDGAARLADRECLTWEIDNHLKFGMVPETRFVELPNGMKGSWQRFVDDAVEGREFKLGKISDEDRFKTSIMDFLTSNTDRHGRNFMQELSSGKVHLIDNGYLYPDTANGGYVLDNYFTNRLMLNEIRTAKICGEYQLRGIDSKITDELRDQAVQQLKTLDIGHLGTKWKLSSSAIDSMEERRSFLVWALKEKRWGEVWEDYKGYDPFGIAIPKDIVKAYDGRAK